MRPLVLFALLALCVLPAALAQYSCPLIAFSQAVAPSPHSSSAPSSSFALSFNNESPHLPLSLLDAHYSINGGESTNVRIAPAAASAAQSSTAAFLLQPSDTLDYSFTYRVEGLGLACDTQHYQVTGREVRAHGEAGMRSAGDDHAAAAPAVEERPSMTLPPIHTSNPAVVVPPMEAAVHTERDLAALEPPPPIGAVVQRESAPLDQNLGVCPLIPFKQQVTGHFCTLLHCPSSRPSSVLLTAALLSALRCCAARVGATSSR